MTTEAAALATIQSLISTERFREAQSTLASLQTDAWSGIAKAEAELLRLRVDDIIGDEVAVDQLILRAMAVLPGVESGIVRARFLQLLAGWYGRKRCDQLAMAAAKDAAAQVPASALGPVAIAQVHLVFDRRQDAIDVLDAAVGLADSERLHIIRARAAYLVGDFDKALACANAAESHPETVVAAVRWKISLAHARGEWGEQLGLLDRVLELTAGGEYARADRVSRATTLYRMDRVAAAKEALLALWKEDETDGHGRFARNVLNALERHPDGKRVVLEAFPSTVQKWCFCGPVCLELILRHFGKLTDQDAIGAEVKGPQGTPVLRMTQFLEGQGFQVRRFEWTLDRLEACLANGLPVIVEEEYSMSFHVVLVIGIDRRTEMLTLKDPMTHLPFDRLAGTQTSMGNYSMHSALVAFPRDRDELGAALDAADVRDAAHLRVFDSCAEEVDDGPSKKTLATATVIERCRKAMSLRAGYVQAHYRLTAELLEVARSARTDAARAEFLRELRQLRTRHRDVEQAHQVHGRYLSWRGSHEEALIEHDEALFLDPWDVKNALAVARSELALGRKDDATKAFWKALRLDPADEWANAEFAAHALASDDLDLAKHLSACAQTLAPHHPPQWMTAARVALKQDDHATAVAHARRAFALDPAWARTELAEVLGARGETRQEALDLYLAETANYPGWFFPRLAAADQLRLLDRVPEAVALLREGIRAASDDPAPLVRKVFELLQGKESKDEAVRVAVEIGRERSDQDARYEVLTLLEEHDANEEILSLVNVASDSLRPIDSFQAGRALLALGIDHARAERLLTLTVERASRYLQARLALCKYLVVTHPERSAEYLKDESVRGNDSTAWRYAAEAELELGHFDTAQAFVERSQVLGAHFGSYGLEIYGRALCRGRDPKVLFDLPRPPEGTPPVLAECHARIRLSVALSLDVPEAVDAALAEIEDNDVSIRSFLFGGAIISDHYRDLAEEYTRLEIARRAKEGKELGWRDQVIYAASLAARGDSSRLDQLAPRMSPDDFDTAVFSLSIARHPELYRQLRATREAKTTKPVDIAVERLDTLRNLGEWEACGPLAKRAFHDYPNRPYLREMAAIAALAEGDPRGRALMEGYYASTEGWGCAPAYLSAAFLLDGDIPLAHRTATRAAENQIFGGGFPATYQASWAVAVLAAIAGDVAGVAEAINPTRAPRGVCDRLAAVAQARASRRPD